MNQPSTTPLLDTTLNTTALTTAPEPKLKPAAPERLPLSVQVIRYFGPGCLAGITTPDLLRLLAENRFQVSFRYLGKIAHLAGSSLVTTPLGWLESAVYARRLKSTQVEAPVFILGSWRSGTTHLHNLLSQDDRFSAPDMYETLYPRTYCLSRWWWEPLLKLGLPAKRFMDNVSMNFSEPAEDELAIAVLCQKSNALSWAFSRREDYYERYLSFEQATDADRALFKQALLEFVTKVQCTRQHPLILKSPNHTARIKLILEVFPQARFLHIRRHPYHVFRSFLHMAQQVIPVWSLQKYDFSQLESMVIRVYRQLYQAYFEQRELIPAGQLHEISYEELVADPLLQIQQAYDALQLPEFQQMEPRLQTYLDKIKNYSNNRHPQIPAAQRKRLHTEWDFCFENWGYAQDLTDL